MARRVKDSSAQAPYAAGALQNGVRGLPGSCLHCNRETHTSSTTSAQPKGEKDRARGNAEPREPIAVARIERRVRAEIIWQVRRRANVGRNACNDASIRVHGRGV